MRFALGFAALGLLTALGAGLALRREPVPAPIAEAAPDPGAAGALKARVVSWDIGFRPPTEAEWMARAAQEVRDASAAGVDVLILPELFASGLLAYAPDERPHEFVTRRVNDALLPMVKQAAAPQMLVCLGSYAHQEPGWKHALNRSPVLLNGQWHFVDKIHPTQGELAEATPIKPGAVLPVFEFRGGRVAVLVCFSLEMPEVAAALKKEGVHLILGPTATGDEDGAARVLRTAAARAVELGAAVLVAPLVGDLGSWKNVGSAACYLPAQKGIDHRPRESPRRTSGIARDDFGIPWPALLNLREQGIARETRPFLADQPFRVERR